jgi:photosystem II stability/assembly factor-like uncharacterized protein
MTAIRTGLITALVIAVALPVLGGIPLANRGLVGEPGLPGGPALLEVKAGAIETNLEALRAVERQGALKLAGRVEDAGFFYAWAPALQALRNRGIAYSILLENTDGSDIYLVPKMSGVDRTAMEGISRVIAEAGSSYLVAVRPDGSAGILALRAKQLLAGPTEAGLPLLSARSVSEMRSRQAMTYNPRIQALVDSVSQTSLYDMLGGLSGEHQVTIGGAPYTISTRYSSTDGNRQAAQWLKEQFEAMGVQADYDYFNFRKVLQAVDFPVDNLSGWTVGGSMILHTDDGGLAWDKLEDGTDATLTGIAMHDNTTGCVVGSGSTILVTHDGTTWQQVTAPAVSDLHDVCFPDSLVGYACGSGGTILKSSNGGSTWAKLTSGTTGNLKAIWFGSATQGWVVGSSGLIRRTTNGGSTWQTVTSPVTDELEDVCFATPTTGCIVGLGGVILRTTDGATWQKLTSPVSYDLYGVRFIDGSVGWICGYVGTILKTTDSGASWISHGLSPINYQFGDICFADADEGWAVGNATIMHSSDGGITWASQTDNIRAGDVNVVGTIPGTTHPEEIYLFCGHFDDTSPNYSTYAPGADDNGTGTIAALEAARVLRNEHFEATLKFVCVSREEQGLVGSGAYAREARARGDSIVAALEFDMIAYVDVAPEDIDIIYNTPSFWMATDYEAAADLYVPGLEVVKLFMPAMASSDQKSFWDNGYCSFCGIEDANPTNPNYHSIRDRISTLNFGFYAQVVKAAVGMAAEKARIDTVTSSVPDVIAEGPLKVGPNPGRGDISIRMAVGRQGAPQVSVYDVTGRLVKSLVPSVAAGVASAVWHGDDASGAKVGAGIYFVKAQGRTQAAKVILLR